MKLLPALTLAAVLGAPAVHAAPAGLEVVGAWSRPAVAGTNGVGYITVINHGPKADALVRIETPAAARVDMHSMSTAGGVMSMEKIETAPVPAGGEAVFAPGGYHLMLMELNRTLKIGDQVPATLTFRSGGRLKAVFKVAIAPPAV